MRPVAVIVPNHLLGVWLSRSIFAETGHMAIDFMLAHELAWRVAMADLLREGRARVPENVDVALLLAAIPEAVAQADTPDYLRAAAPGVELALHVSLADALLELHETDRAKAHYLQAANSGGSSSAGSPSIGISRVHRNMTGFFAA